MILNNVFNKNCRFKMNLGNVRNFIFFLVFLPFLFSCNNRAQQGKGLTQEEKQFVSRFQNELLIKTTNRSLNIQEVKVESEDDIVEINSQNVVPVVYDRLLTTKHMESDHQKSLFINQLLPQILIAKFFMEQEKEMVNIILSDEKILNANFEDQKQFIRKQLKKHDAENSAELIQKLTTHPTSLVLAQAAIESNWGSSLSYGQANNPFHILSDYKSEPRIKTFGQNDETVFLKKYEYLPAAIADYFRNINTQDGFKEFRNRRRMTQNPAELARYLEDYSPQHDEKYVELLTNVIKRNELTKYDNYAIDKEFVDELTEQEIAEIIEEQTRRRKNVVSSDSERIEQITERSIDIQFKELSGAEDIVPVESKFVVPHVYTNVISLKHLPVDEKKQKFFDMLLPSVMVAAFGIRETRKKLSSIAQRIENGKPVTKADSLFLEKQMKDWKATSTHNLLNEKMVTRPNSIMLAQAALETGWGSSRFFVHATNTFGVWSYNPDESRIRATETRSGEPVYVRKYENLSLSIVDYYKVIARGPYSEYREQRIESDDPYEMVNYLFRYSEIGQEYIRRLKTVMRKSNLEKYDDYQIDPKYITE